MEKYENLLEIVCHFQSTNQWFDDPVATRSESLREASRACASTSAILES